MSYQTGALDMTLLNGEQVDQVKDDPEFTSVEMCIRDRPSAGR